MIYGIIFAAVVFTVGLQVIAAREVRVRESPQFQRENRKHSTPSKR